MLLKKKREGKKYKTQWSKLLAISGSRLYWSFLEFIEDLFMLANDSRDLEAPWMYCEIGIFQTLDYFLEYEAKIFSLVWWRIKCYIKIEDFEDFLRWKFLAFDIFVYSFRSYVWFHSLLWNWTWKWIGWCFLFRVLSFLFLFLVWLS